MKELRKVIGILSSVEQRRFAWLGLAILIMGLLEVIGVASILPFIQLIADPGVIVRNSTISSIYNFVGFSSHRQMLLWTGAAVLLLILFTNAFSVFTNWLKYRYSWQLAHDVSTRLLMAYLKKPYAFFLSTPTTEMTSYILAEVTSLTNGVVLPLVEAFSRAFVSLTLFGLLFWVDPKIASIMFSTLGLAYVAIYLLQRKQLSHLGERRIKLSIQRYRALREIFDGIKTVKVYNRQRFFFDHFHQASKEFTDIQPVYQVTLSSPRNVLEFLAFGSIIAITIYMYTQFGSIEKAIPKLSLYAVAGYRLLPALQNAFSAVGSFRHNYPAVEKIYPELMAARQQEDLEYSENIAPLRLQKNLRLENIDFTYAEADRPTILNANLEIDKGETIAFVGSTGSGKTTMVDIIVGLLVPESGKILVDERPIDTENVANWRATVAYVPQDVFLFDDTVVRNITLVDDAELVDHELLEKAARLADIYEFIQTLPDAFETKIGERGVRLSGGQRQRLGLARALYTQPSVLILDEATSALDNVTERGIIQSLRNLPRDITTIVIAHRLSTVQNADRIYLLEEGEITGEGSFETLIDSSESFKEMAYLA